MNNSKITLNGYELRRVLLDGIEFLGYGTTRVTCLHDNRLKNCNDLDELDKLGYDVHVIPANNPSEELGVIHIMLDGRYDLRIIGTTD